MRYRCAILAGFLFSAPVVAAPSAREAAGAAPLKLSPELIDKIETYAKTAATVRAKGTDADLCGLMRSAGELGRTLAVPISRAWDSGEDTGLIQKAQESLLAVLPGVDVSIYANDNRGGIGYESMAAFAKEKHPATAALLRGAGELLDGKVPAYTTMLTDDQGCTDFTPAQNAIEHIVESWDAAPECIKKDLTSPLSEAIAGTSDPNLCYCLTKAETVRAAKRFSASLRRLKDLGGAKAAKQMEADLGRPEAAFQCGVSN